MSQAITDAVAKVCSSEVFGAGDYDDAPDIAEFAITEDKAQEIVRLAKIVANNKLHTINKFDFTPNWVKIEHFVENDTGVEPVEEKRLSASTEGSTLTISDIQFWYSGYIKHTDIKFRTDRFSIKELAEHFDLDFPGEGEITINLNIFDDAGNQVDSTTCPLTEAQISDIIDHASQAILVRRRCPAEVGNVLDELEDALEVSDVINKKTEDANGR